MAGNWGRASLRIGLVVLAALATGGALLAQSSWSFTYGGSAQDRFYRVQATPDGGYLVLGDFVTPAGDWEGRLIKTGPTGVLAWAKTYGGPGDDYLYRMEPTPDGGYLLGGSTTSFGAGGDDVWIIKVDADGNPLWQRAYGQSGDEDLEGIAAAADGGVYAVADVTLAGQGPDFWVFRTDAAGVLLWSKTVGGTGADYPGNVLALPGGRCAVLGSTDSFGFPRTRGWLVTFDGAGAIDSQGAFGAVDSEFYPDDASLTADGGAFVLGTYYGPGSSNEQVVVLKLDGAGTIAWQTSFGGDHNDECYRIVTTADGGCVALGSTASFGAGNVTDGLAVRLSGSGAIVWQKRYGGSYYDYLEDAAATTDGGFLLVGTKDYDGPNLGSGWLLKVRGADGTMDSACSFVTPTAFVTAPTAGVVSLTVAAAAAYAAQQVSTGDSGPQAGVASSALCYPSLTCTLDATASVPTRCTVGLPTPFQVTVAVADCLYLPTFSWDFGDGSSSTLQNPTHAYATGGTFDWSVAIVEEGLFMSKTGSVTAVEGPAVASMAKVAPPFTIVVKGSGFQSGVQVFINGAPWSGVLYKNAGKIKLTGGKSLKAVVPKGVQTAFRFVNPDGGEAEMTWSW